MYTDKNFAHRNTEVPDFAHRPEVVIELGAQSLKVHTRWPRDVRTVKYPYFLGHEVYTTGFISEATAHKIVDLCRPLADQTVLAVGTSAVRDAENCDGLIDLVRRHLGIVIHPLSCQQEAALLAHGYRAYASRLPALVADVGGGSLEIVFLSRSGTLLWDSLPLGAIRLSHACQVDDSFCPVEWIESNLQKSAIVMANEIYATGGVVKAIATTLAKSTFELDEVVALEERVRREGAPEDLKPARRRVFLPGLALVRTLMEFVRAKEIRCLPICIGRILMDLAWKGAAEGAEEGVADTPARTEAPAETEKIQKGVRASRRAILGSSAGRV